jgi:hypothetical protein
MQWQEEYYNEIENAIDTLQSSAYNKEVVEKISAKYGEKRLRIGRKCEQLRADYDLQMLMADDYQQLQQYDEAERHYWKTALMCLLKFMPLYRLTKLYDATGSKSRAQELAKIIPNKRIKIPSPAIASIREEMRQLTERGMSDSVTPGGTDVEPLTTKPWQDTVSEQTTPETLLPP